MIPVFITLFLYAVLHSWMAGAQIKNAFRSRFGDRAYYGLYRLVYNVVAVLGLLPVSYLFTFYPGRIVWQINRRYEPILLLIQVIGLGGLVVSLLQIDLWRFLGIRQLIAYLTNQPLPLLDEKLQTRGLYALVRHPLYLFSILAIFPVTTMTEAYLAFCIGVTAYFIVGSIMEEKRLVSAYGEEYKAYRARVPRIVPFIKLP